jgi:hypothetical protein
MISAELVHLIRQRLQPLQRNVWYAINITDAYNPTLNVAIQLNDDNCTTFMLATGIMSLRGIKIVISLDHLEFLKAALQENMTIHISWKAYKIKTIILLSLTGQLTLHLSDNSKPILELLLIEAATS